MSSGSRKPRKNSCRLAMPIGTPPPEMVWKFALVCLVPLLADVCLREWRAAELTAEVKTKIKASEPLCKESAAN
jgi:hypothetical protein